MKSCWSVSAITLIIAPVLAPGAEIRVPEDQPTIQGAINAAAAGDLVSVAPGNYVLSTPLDFNGKDIAVVGRNGRDQTTLEAAGKNSLALLVDVNGPDGRLQGMTFRNGTAELVQRGGCVSVERGTPLIVDNRFQNCSTIEGDARSSGGAVKVVSGGRPEIRGNEFIGNRSFSQGGAVHIIDSNGVLIANVFRDNHVAGQPESGGGGLKVTFSVGEPVEVRGNLFENNSATFAGGAISVFAGDADIIDNEIRGNGPTRFGAAVHLETNSSSGGDRQYQVIGNLMANNIATDVAIEDINPNYDSVSGGAMHINLGPQGATTDSSIEIRGNHFEQNSATDSRCVDGHPDFSCAVGGGVEFLNALVRPQEVSDNVFESNVADRYGAANFDKVQLVFYGNLVLSNRAGRSHPGVGCVADSNASSNRCIVRRNRFMDNRFVGGEFGVAELNNAGALNVRRHEAWVINNLFVNNHGHYATLFNKHDDAGLEGLVSRIEHNTFVGNDRDKPWFGTVAMLGQVSLQNNVFVGDFRAFRVDNADTRSRVRANNITGTLDSLARFDTDDPDSSVTFTTISGLNAFELASGNTAFSPEFRDPGAGDYSLPETSPLVDLVACIAGIDHDLRGFPRPSGAACDAGAYEFGTDVIFGSGFEATR